MDLSVFFAGTGGAVPAARRGMPATLLKAGGDRMLFDCGEGTQRQLIQSVGLAALDAVFITHLHADHWLGLPGMLRTFSLQGREHPIVVHGPPGLVAMMRQMRFAFGDAGYRVHVEEHDLGANEESVVLRREGRHPYSIAAFPVTHAVPAIGYRFLEDDRPGALDPHAARALGVEHPEDFGVLQRGGTVAVAGGEVRPEQVIGPARHGRRVVVTGDTRPDPVVAGAARGASLLVHEATFASADAQRAAATGHSTATEAAQVARAAEVEMLALVHLSQRVRPSEIRREAEAAFGAPVLVPRDFDTVEIPFPEHGAPRHLAGAESRRAWGVAEPADADPVG